jgi:hypothetical protein
VRGIFITYRREDAQGFAGRLDDDLSERFGDALIFRDREIGPGEDFAKRLRATLDSADVALAVIGPRWEDARDAHGQRRLEHADDWVRIELETVLARGIPVVPVLVGGARMPAPASLPESLEEFSRRQAYPLSDLRWHAEVSELAGRLAAMSPTLGRAFRAHGGALVSASDTSAARHLAARVFEEATRRSREARATTRPRRHLRLLRWFSVRTKQLITTAVVPAIVYVLMREFGGPDLNRFFDRFVARAVETARTLITHLIGP